MSRADRSGSTLQDSRVSQDIHHGGAKTSSQAYLSFPSEEMSCSHLGGGVRRVRRVIAIQTFATEGLPWRCPPPPPAFIQQVLVGY